MILVINDSDSRDFVLGHKFEGVYGIVIDVHFHYRLATKQHLSHGFINYIAQFGDILCQEVHHSGLCQKIHHFPCW